ncbi:MAG: RdgB/HAM1 family non-canonical purine NTP pyrophosphatase [Candidatus Coatesbacteria bacterium]|nr:MAG: RdgB/HAM1 family non-canonical purine NTP pyrophosphatase [Candidatus Coatesbacteria bacterium]
MRIILATNNENKVAEISAILDAFGITVEGAASAGGMPEVEEDGVTFAENALAKARAGARNFGEPALADDSGLEIPALDGRPGVYSARYAGPSCSYADNNRKLLGEMTDLEGDKRRGRFVCSAALAFPDGQEYVVEGELFGTITTEPRGSGGFGYDPVFVPDGRGRTLAEMNSEEKNDISHRRRAFEKMAGVLRNLAASGAIESLAEGEKPPV